MKTTTTLTLILIFTVQAFAQRQVKITALNSHSNYLYAGIDNPLIIKDQSKDKVFYLKSSNGEIFIDGGTHIAMPARSGRARIAVYEITPQQDTVFLYQQDFLVYSIPHPTLVIGDQKVDEMNHLKKEDLLEGNLGVYINEDIKNCSDWVNIIGFTIGYSDKGAYKTIYNEGSLLNQQVYQQIADFDEGSDIAIKVDVSSEGDIIRSLPVYRTKIF